MPEIKKMLKEVVAKTAKTMEIPEKSIKQITTTAETIKKTATTIPGKKA